MQIIERPTTASEFLAACDAHVCVALLLISLNLTGVNDSENCHVGRSRRY